VVNFLWQPWPMPKLNRRELCQQSLQSQKRMILKNGQRRSSGFMLRTSSDSMCASTKVSETKCHQATSGMHLGVYRFQKTPVLNSAATRALC